MPATEESPRGADDKDFETMMTFIWALCCFIWQAIVMCGIAGNIINIICFKKQGFTDSVNINLLGLSISDLGCLIPLTWGNILFIPVIKAKDLPFDPVNVYYLISGTPYVCFSRISSWITAIITLERCLCVIAPLKVKTIITPKRASAIILCVFIILLPSVAPTYVVNGLGMKFSTRLNKTLLGLVSKANREDVDKISFSINNFFIPFIAFVLIVIFTIVLAIKLRDVAHWRNTSASSSQAERVSSKNQRVAKMVLIVSALYIFCSFPVCISMLAVAIDPGLYFTDKYADIGLMALGVSLFLQSINSSVNIFIYYHMSSKYKDTFMIIFCISNKCVSPNET